MQNRTHEQIVVSPMPQLVEECVQNRTPEQIVDFPVPQFMEAAVENCVGEQISNSFVPQFMGADVEIMHATPQERMQTRTLEQTAAFPVPQFSEERVHDRLPEQIMDFPVSQNMEAYAGRVRDIPLERVQLHSFVRPKRVFVDFLSLHQASKPYTGKVFTVNLRHHRDDFAHSDNLGFIKGLDKHNMPRFGDVMVPPLQITKGVVGHVEQVVSWFDRKSQVAADGPLYRFQPKRRVAVAAPSSNVELLRLQQSGGREGNCGGSAGAVLDRGRCARAARWILGHYFLSPFLTVPLLRLRVSLGGF